MNTCLLSVVLLSSALAVGKSASCNPAPTKPPQTRPVSVGATLRAKQQIWKKHNLKNYRFTLRVVAFSTLHMMGPVIIEVRNGVAKSVKPTEERPYFDAKAFAQHNTIDKLFRRIDEAIKNKEQVEVSYNSKYGYPTSAYLNPLIPDGSERLLVSNFAPLPQH